MLRGKRSVLLDHWIRWQYGILCRCFKTKFGRFPSSFAKTFHYELVLNFVKYLFSCSWCDHMTFLLQPVYTMGCLTGFECWCSLHFCSKPCSYRIWSTHTHTLFLPVFCREILCVKSWAHWPIFFGTAVWIILASQNDLWVFLPFSLPAWLRFSELVFFLL